MNTSSKLTPNIQTVASSLPPLPPPSASVIMTLAPLMLRSLARLVASMIDCPTASLTTILYYSGLLPQNVRLERMVRHELLDDENYLFHFLINFLRCFW
uniref:Uncharacterized protein n=1 Tax=Kalanchoe fedtschenkoi TaxID=63787 RepID=A0A7N0T8D0_KALFE